jgi:branched-subunit amino acid permease
MKNLLIKTNKAHNRKNIFRGLVTGICLSFLLYGLGITGTTLSIADAKANNSDMADLQTQIAELEIEYFEIVNTLSLSEAQILGMEEQDNVYYALIDDVKTVAYNL